MYHQFVPLPLHATLRCYEGRSEDNPRGCATRRTYPRSLPLCSSASRTLASRSFVLCCSASNARRQSHLAAFSATAMLRRYIREGSLLRENAASAVGL